jgi:hypothetical protein
MRKKTPNITCVFIWITVLPCCSWISAYDNNVPSKRFCLFLLNHITDHHFFAVQSCFMQRSDATARVGCLRHCPLHTCTVLHIIDQKIEERLKTFYSRLNTALDNACPKRAAKEKTDQAWWNQECQDARNHCKVMEDKAFDKKNKAKNKGPPSNHLFAIFREAQRECKRAYKKAKTESWRKLAGSVCVCVCKRIFWRRWCDTEIFIWSFIAFQIQLS